VGLHAHRCAIATILGGLRTALRRRSPLSFVGPVPRDPMEPAPWGKPGTQRLWRAPWPRTATRGAASPTPLVGLHTCAAPPPSHFRTSAGWPRPAGRKKIHNTQGHIHGPSTNDSRPNQPSLDALSRAQTRDVSLRTKTSEWILHLYLAGRCGIALPPHQSPPQRLKCGWDPLVRVRMPPVERLVAFGTFLWHPQKNCPWPV
jgi:hypothetical protein